MSASLPTAVRFAIALSICACGGDPSASFPVTADVDPGVDSATDADGDVTAGYDAADGEQPDGAGGDDADADSTATDGDDGTDTPGDAANDAPPRDATSDVSPPGPPSCAPAAGGGSEETTRPILAEEFADRWHAGWRASPVVADIDGDGAAELLAPREGLLIVYEWDGSQRLRLEVPGRTWASPVVADLLPDRPGLEIVTTVRDAIYAWDARGDGLPGFPVSVVDELRSLAVGDVDGDGDLEIVVASTLMVGAPIADVLYAFHHDGSAVAGFPPFRSGSSGCDDWCFTAGAFDENLAVGDLDGDGSAEIVLTQDNAYMTIHRGTGEVLPCASIFDFPTRVLGVRMMLDYGLARQGYPNDEALDLQAHGTNSSPAIADLDGDGSAEVVILATVQSADQLSRELGVALWVVRPDGSRAPGWEEPLHIREYIAGLDVFEGANLPEASQAVAVADIDPESAGLEIVFPGLDGQLHAASADGRLLWSLRLTSSPNVLVGGAAIADMSGDGRPEIAVTTWGPEPGAHALTVVSSGGRQLHRMPLPDPGSMSTPTIADADQDGALEIVVNISGGVDGTPQLMAFRVPGSATNCLPWPTGRGNYRRDGTVPTAER